MVGLDLVNSTQVLICLSVYLVRKRFRFDPKKMSETIAVLGLLTLIFSTMYYATMFGPR